MIGILIGFFIGVIVGMFAMSMFKLSAQRESCCACQPDGED
jgi:hypothetical protein